MRTCEVCVKPLVRGQVENRRKWERRRFCSRACLYIAQRTDRSRSCERCAQLFTPTQRGRRRDGTRFCFAACGRPRGPEHFAWRDSATLTNAGLRSRSREWAMAVKRRDSWTCRECGVRASQKVRVVADHIRPWATHPDLRFDLANGRTLCFACHTSTPSFGRTLAAIVRTAA